MAELVEQMIPSAEVRSSEIFLNIYCNITREDKPKRGRKWSIFKRSLQEITGNYFLILCILGNRIGYTISGLLYMPPALQNYSFVYAEKDQDGNFTFGGRKTVNSFSAVRMYYSRSEMTYLKLKSNLLKKAPRENRLVSYIN